MKLTQLGSLYKLIRGESRTMRKSVAKQPRQRASAFVLESLENRVLLSATPMDVTTTEPVVTAAVVTTDKPDYAPGETALITTSNTSAEGLKFGDGELVQFQVTRTDGIEDAPMGNLPWYVTDGVGGFNAYQEFDANGQAIDRNADGMADWIRPDNDLTVNGSISTDWFVEDQYLGASLLLTATGQASGAVATTEFTDAITLDSVIVGTQTGSLFTGTAGSATYGIQVDYHGNNSTISFAVSGLPSGVTASFSPSSVLNPPKTPNTATTLTLSTTAGVAAGTYTFTVQASGGGTKTNTGTLVVSALTSITPTFSASNKIYNGDNSATVSFTGFSPSVGANNVTVSYTSATFSNANAGTGKTVTIAGLSLSGTDAYKYALSSTTASTTANIAQADANVTITPYSGTYDAAAHNLTGTVVGVAGDLAATGSSLTFGASFINAPGGTGSWNFEGGTNYLDESGTAAVTIAQADANVTITPYSGTYDAAAHNLTGTVVGVAGDLAATGSSLTFGASFINAPGGTGSWNFEGGTNYLDESGTAAVTIAQADANVTITPYSGTYDAAAHNLTGTVVGVAGDLAATGSSLTFGASFINAPGGTGSWNFEGGTNYLDESGTAAVTIAQADANVTITPYSGTYDAAAHNLTGTVVGVAGDLAATGSSLTFGASFINAPGGTGSWNFEGGTNYLDESGTAAVTIAQADANVTITPYSGTYDAAAHNLTGTVVGVAGDLAATGSSLTFGASFINAPGGTGSWNFEGGTNYLDESGTAAVTIAQADANVTITPYSGTYDAAAHNLTGTVVGVAGDLAATGSSLTFGASFINAPGGTGSWNFEGGTNYLDESGTAAVTIAQADANVTITPYSGTYDAAAHNLTGTVVGVAGDLAATGSSLTFGASFINAPGGTGSWNFEGGTNYLDESGTAAVTIAQANLTINIGNTTKTFGQTINLATALDPTFLTGINGENLSISSYTSAGVPVAALVGPYAITGVVADGTGLASNYTVTLTSGTLTVTTPSVITTVQDGVNLIIVGTGGCDTIVVNASNPSAITVNGAGSYSVGTSGHVIVYGMACDDNISLIGNINLEAHGGVGNDTITGGAGHDVIFGDTGIDTLTGAAGNDVLVGGHGSDRLVGSAGHDILISHEADDVYDYDDLRNISDNWASGWSPDSGLLESTSDDVVDESVDQLTGSSGHDWFIVGTGDKITDSNSATKDGDIKT